MEICEGGGVHWGVNCTIFMKLHSPKEITDMLKILCKRIFTCEENNKLIVPRSGGDLRKWYLCDLKTLRIGTIFTLKNGII